MGLLDAPEIGGGIDMMCSLTGLTSFSTQVIHGLDIIPDPRPWYV